MKKISHKQIKERLENYQNRLASTKAKNIDPNLSMLSADSNGIQIIKNYFNSHTVAPTPLNSADYQKIYEELYEQLGDFQVKNLESIAEQNQRIDQEIQIETNNYLIKLDEILLPNSNWFLEDDILSLDSLDKLNKAHTAPAIFELLGVDGDLYAEDYISDKSDLKIIKNYEYTTESVCFTTSEIPNADDFRMYIFIDPNEDECKDFINFQLKTLIFARPLGLVHYVKNQDNWLCQKQLYASEMIPVVKNGKFVKYKTSHLDKKHQKQVNNLLLKAYSIYSKLQKKCEGAGVQGFLEFQPIKEYDGILNCHGPFQNDKIIS